MHDVSIQILFYLARVAAAQAGRAVLAAPDAGEVAPQGGEEEGQLQPHGEERQGQRVLGILLFFYIYIKCLYIFNIHLFNIYI